MKVTKQCSECGGREIYTAEGVIGGHTGALLPGINVDGYLGSRTNVEIYICGQCGHYQFFFGQKALEKIKEKYKRYS